MRKVREVKKMTSLITIPIPCDQYESSWTKTQKTKRVTTRWFHPRETINVDKLVHELASDANFIRYVKLSNKEILKNPDMYEDMAEKYK